MHLILLDELNCSICLDIYTEPVNLKCGHNFCKLCIGNELDNQKESGIYSCPECRAEYRERPKLHKNTALCNIAERCRSTQPAENVTGITCTYCVHAPVSAAKTCLHCEASLCETHLKVETLNEAHEKKKQRLNNVMDELKRQREEISVQEEQVSLQISDRIQELKEMKSELSKEMGDIEKLQNMTDPLAALPVQESFSAGCGDALKEGKKHDLCVNRIANTLEIGLSGIINGLKRNQDVIKITKTLLDINTSPDISLDENTASNEVNVSSDLKTVSWTQQSENRPETPERFEFYPQVLSIRGFTSGRHYWEVETSGDGWIIGMAYPSIDRKGGQSYNNYNAIDLQYFRRYKNAHRRTQQIYGIHSYMGDNKSWRLCRINNMYSVMSNGTVTQLNLTQSFQRIGIYLDYEAGQFSFFPNSVSLFKHSSKLFFFFTPLVCGVSFFRRLLYALIGGCSGFSGVFGGVNPDVFAGFGEPSPSFAVSVRRVCGNFSLHYDGPVMLAEYTTGSPKWVRQIAPN
uniref:Uncharacterized protein n=1 Tax=Leptobrachium leishanense TaxID=445787 RepID=A0A8C5R0U4_9ANUR